MFNIFWCYFSQHHTGVIPASNLIGAVIVMSNKYV